MPCVLKLKTMKRVAATDHRFEATCRGMTSGIDLVRLRAVLPSEPLRTVFVTDDGVGDEELTPASVLFPIVLRETGPSVLLTQRTEDLRDHPGQISFPGGRVEPEDASPAHTALREAREEIGLLEHHVEVIGYLPEYRTITGYRIMPVVAFVRPPFALHPDSREVAEVFEVPLSFLLDSANHKRHTIQLQGKVRDFFAVPYGDRFIWGATAGIILGLARLVSND